MPANKVDHTDQPRIAVFTHDTYGLGHVQRCLPLIHAQAERLPRSALLLITGSPAVHTLQALPPNADCVKISTLVKTGAQGSHLSHLPVAVPEVQYMRRHLIQKAVLTFAPDIFLVDNFPSDPIANFSLSSTNYDVSQPAPS